MNIEWLLKRAEGNPLPERPIRVLGIDLGTTNSVVAEAVWDPTTPDEARVSCLEVDQATSTGRLTGALVPSVVALVDGQHLVGEGAKRLIAQAPDLKLSRGTDYFFETKNEIGTGRIYNRAPEGYRTPAEIGGHVIEFLEEAAGEPAPDAVVVTAPASFQAAQRRDTLEAAGLAGLRVGDGDLFDEPIAAYIDYFATRLGSTPAADFQPGRRLLVFDYGGGTCDIALFDVAYPSGDTLLEISPLSISRFHRLGGGDVDAAIVYRALVDQIVEQNDLKPGDLGFDDKKHFIEPALRSVAESLKIGLCQETKRRRELEADGASYDEPPKRTLPGAYEVPLRSGRVLHLRNPTLDRPHIRRDPRAVLRPRRTLRQDQRVPHRAIDLRADRRRPAAWERRTPRCRHGTSGGRQFEHSRVPGRDREALPLPRVLWNSPARMNASSPSHGAPRCKRWPRHLPIRPGSCGRSARTTFSSGPSAIPCP